MNKRLTICFCALFFLCTSHFSCASDASGQQPSGTTATNAIQLIPASSSSTNSSSSASSNESRCSVSSNQAANAPKKPVVDDPYEGWVYTNDGGFVDDELRGKPVKYLLTDLAGLGLCVTSRGIMYETVNNGRNWQANKRKAPPFNPPSNTNATLPAKPVGILAKITLLITGAT